MHSGKFHFGGLIEHKMQVRRMKRMHTSFHSSPEFSPVFIASARTLHAAQGRQRHKQVHRRRRDAVDQQPARQRSRRGEASSKTEQGEQLGRSADWHLHPLHRLPVSQDTARRIWGHLLQDSARWEGWQKVSHDPHDCGDKLYRTTYHMQGDIRHYILHALTAHPLEYWAEQTLDEIAVPKLSAAMCKKLLLKLFWLPW